jgi:nitrite reductase/ring-hydroxylating ferredoxin subunit
MSFGPDAYAQGERFQLEKRRLFADAWLPLCASGQLAGPGAFVSHTIGGWPLVAIRARDGVARAFRNVCRHQGMPVVEKPAGTCEALRCRYHGWVYDLTGAFVSAPPLVAPSDPEAAMHHLDALTLDEAGGVIQVRGRARGETPAPRFDLGDAAFTGATSLDIDANWKTVIEFLLPDPAWRFVWPLAFVGGAASTRVVRQIVPRSFVRTRVVDLLFGDGTLDVAGVKAGAEALQARRAAGDCASDDSRVEQFQQQLSAACGL